MKIHMQYVTIPLEDGELWFEGEGWYFENETNNYEGPYDTAEACVRAAIRYNRWLEGIALEEAIDEARWDEEEDELYASEFDAEPGARSGDTPYEDFDDSELDRITEDRVARHFEDRGYPDDVPF